MLKVGVQDIFVFALSELMILVVRGDFYSAGSFPRIAFFLGVQTSREDDYSVRALERGCIAV